MPTIEDEEFGTIILRRSAKSSHVRIRVAPNGRLRASLPLYAPVFLVRRLVKSSRDELRAMLNDSNPTERYEDGMLVGKSHTLIVRSTAGRHAIAKRHGQQLIISLPSHLELNDPSVVQVIRDGSSEALRVEAKSYLPKRLAFLAEKFGFHYDKIRFSHASGRWGSCSSNGTISLNIALMKIPFELIDYVLVHELSHTKQMNHSELFWQLVEQSDQHYIDHRRQLKKYTPSI